MTIASLTLLGIGGILRLAWRATGLSLETDYDPGNSVLNELHIEVNEQDKRISGRCWFRHLRSAVELRLHRNVSETVIPIALTKYDMEDSIHRFRTSKMFSRSWHGKSSLSVLDREPLSPPG